MYITEWKVLIRITELLDLVISNKHRHYRLPYHKPKDVTAFEYFGGIQIFPKTCSTKMWEY